MIRRAAARGAFAVLRGSDPRHPKTAAALRLIIDGLRAEEDAAALDRRYFAEVVLLSGEITLDHQGEEEASAALDEKYKTINLLDRGIDAVRRPWIKRSNDAPAKRASKDPSASKKEKEKEEIAQLKADWEKMYGRLDDPKVQAAIARDVAKMAQPGKGGRRAR